MSDEHSEQDEANAMEQLLERFREQNPGTELDEERFRAMLEHAIATHPQRETILNAPRVGGGLTVRPFTAESGARRLEVRCALPSGTSAVVGTCPAAWVMRPPQG